MTPKTFVWVLRVITAAVIGMWALVVLTYLDQIWLKPGGVPQGLRWALKTASLGIVSWHLGYSMSRWWDKTAGDQ